MCHVLLFNNCRYEYVFFSFSLLIASVFYRLSLCIILSVLSSQQHRTTSWLSMEWCMYIVSVVAQGLCLCSVSLNSFVKCGFGHSLVGRAEGGRWQQNASFTFFVLSLLCLPWPLSVQCSQSSTFFKRGLVYKLESSELAKHGRRWSGQGHVAGPCCTVLGLRQTAIYFTCAVGIKV